MDGLKRLVQLVGVEPFMIEHPDHKAARSDKWPTLRKHFLAANPECIVSHLKTDLDVHHVKPFHVHPELELDWSNLRTVSRPYHFLIGHFLDWKIVNPDFDDMVRDLRKKIDNARKH